MESKFRFSVMTVKSYWTNKETVELATTAKTQQEAEFIITDMFDGNNMKSQIYDIAPIK